MGGAQDQGGRDTQQHTHCHELGAGTNKLSEAEQEVLLGGQNLGQLQRGRQRHFQRDTDYYQ